MITTKSVKANATAFIESQGVTETAATMDTPFSLLAAKEDIMAAMEKSFLRPATVPFTREPLPNLSLVEVVENNPIMSSMAQEIAAFRSRRQLADAQWTQKSRLFTTFGRYLADDEKKLINACKEGLETIEDKMAALVSGIEAVKSRRAWKAEMNDQSDIRHYATREHATKVDTANGKKWDGALIYDTPPKGEKAYYAIQLPDGKVVNLGQTQGKLGPKLYQYPSQAMQAIATRLGLTMRGGDTAILNHLLGQEPIEWVNEQGVASKEWKYLPSYVTAWQGVWVCRIGWRLNPKVTPSSYWLDANDQLTRQDPGTGEAPLTLSQLDYRLLCESSDLAVENEDGEVVDYMNEEEEFLGFMPQRETETDFIDLSKYCEDDAEMALFQACSATVDRSESGVSIGDLQSSQFLMGYLDAGIKRTTKNLRKMRAQEPSAQLDEIIAGLEQHLARLNHLDGLWNQFIGTSKTDHLVSYWYPNSRNRMMCMSRPDHAKMIPAEIPGASKMQHGTIEQPIVNHVDALPEHNVVTFTWLSALSPRLMTKREREARKGQVFRAIEDGSLQAQLAFNATFNRMLGLA